ncbi:unnamed protein product [Rhizopus stolonifer]
MNVNFNPSETNPTIIEMADKGLKKIKDGKPPYSYATLITTAIEGSEKKMLTLNEIYQWVLERYPYFNSIGNGWKNSIRHNLSLNKCFVRLPRPVNEPGKGSYWQIDHKISKEDSRPKALRNRKNRSGSDPVRRDDLLIHPRSLSLDSNMNSIPMCPHHQYHHHHHHHHHHHRHHHQRHSVDFSRNQLYLNDVGIYPVQNASFDSKATFHLKNTMYSTSTLLNNSK